jgi:hypothetical protein
MHVFIWMVSVVLGCAAFVVADEQFPAVTSKAVTAACSDCHMVYQPQMLPRQSWQTIMDRLDDHFGEDASLEEPVRKEVLTYLLAHAADVDPSESARAFLRGIDPKKPPLRISETPHFIREHRELDATIWRHPKVGFKANCMACHTGAAQGNYDDDRVRLP